VSILIFKDLFEAVIANSTRISIPDI